MTQTARELLVAAYKLRHRVSQAIAEEEVGGLLGILELARLKIVAREPTVARVQGMGGEEGKSMTCPGSKTSNAKHGHRDGVCAWVRDDENIMIGFVKFVTGCGRDITFTRKLAEDAQWAYCPICGRHRRASVRG